MSNEKRIAEVEKIMKQERRKASPEHREAIDAGLNWLDHKRETLHLSRNRGGRDTGMGL